MQLKERALRLLNGAKPYGLAFLFWSVLGLLMGVLGGGIGALFATSLSIVNSLRENYNFIIFLMPIGGLAIVGIYKLCRLKHANTNRVFEGVRNENDVPVLLAPAVFVSTAITHLLGGSAGREGAALQIGGSIAAFVGRIFRINERQKHILIMCGMSALFSAVFGTPVGACIFAIEVACVGKLYAAALFPCMVSSCTAFGVATFLGVRPERYTVELIPDYTVTVLGRVILIGIAAALVSILFCFIMHLSHKTFKKFIKNPFLRVAAGGVIIVLMTLIIGNQDYNGSGAHIIEGIFAGQAIRPEAFLLKILFTAVTIGSGYKGGEIVPTIFIGATLGATIAALVGLNATFGAAVGITALFAGVTNCPLTAIFLAIELFGGEGCVFYMIGAAISYLLSGHFSLYTGQKIIISKINNDAIDEKGH